MPVFCETSFSRYTYAARTVVVGSILNGKLFMKDGCVRFFIVVSYRAHIHVTSKVEILEPKSLFSDRKIMKMAGNISRELM